MESCTTTCLRVTPDEDPEVMAAAEALANLLVDRPEFQNFMRLARAVRLDDEVAEILALMNEYPDPETCFDENRDQELQTRLEDLPVMRGYRIAEQSARATFAAVEQTIGLAAGVDFARNAKSGCA